MDSSSQIIAELRSEIAELKKRVSALEERFNQNEEVAMKPNNSSDHKNPCQNVDQCPVLQDSSSVSSVRDFIETKEQHSASALYPKISNVCAVPDPMEIPETAGVYDVADRLTLQEVKEVTSICKNECLCEVPLGLDSDGKRRQTPLKVCSVKLVDCGKMLKQVTERAAVSSKRSRSSTVKKISQGKGSTRRINCSVCGKTLAPTSI